MAGLQVLADTLVRTCRGDLPSRQAEESATAGLGFWLGSGESFGTPLLLRAQNTKGAPEGAHSHAYMVSRVSARPCPQFVAFVFHASLAALELQMVEDQLGVHRLSHEPGSDDKTHRDGHPNDDLVPEGVIPARSIGPASGPAGRKGGW